ncbi:GDSL-type esterase/lipase family protein [Actinoplanes subglobosus]|uniref:GDSL-type esterase/lipase family protein n=1 Tax=Actinoplanes subglobosus TaxID=1547892 RepID=A0ABV8IK60_9ACTN
MPLISATEASAEPVTPPAQAATPPPADDPAAVEPGQRDALLGKGWQQSRDRLWTTSSDMTGFHILVAEASTGYQWRTAASLSEPGIETDAWIGNACVTESGKRAVVVYAPRTYTNKETLGGRGGFTAVVDLDSGVVDRLALRTSLAYFNPGCGAGEKASLTQEGDLDLGRTRIHVLDAATGRTETPVEIPGQLTSPVPTRDGLVGADDNALVEIDRKGKRRLIAESAGVPFNVGTDASGAVVFMEHVGSTARARRSVITGESGKRRVATRTLASGGLDDFGLRRAASGKIFITGEPKTVETLPATTARLDAPVDATVSTRGEAAVTSVERVGNPDPRVTPADPLSAPEVSIEALSLKTRKPLKFTVDPDDAITPRSADTSDPGGYCSVPRNDPRVQVYQPKPKQVEWAVNMAVKNKLTVNRPAGWNNNGLSQSYTPQGLFPPYTLTGTGGAVPAQIMLGILGQESNLWQASAHVMPGEFGNPLIGNYYGIDEEGKSSDWRIDWSKADCGYGVSQMTDGMRKSAHSRDGEIALDPVRQRAIGTDYAAAIAAGMQVIQIKWNQLQSYGVTVNNNDPSKIENWFFATWAYNSGFNAPGREGTNGAWGLGWGNNPANPRYPAGRGKFGSSPHHFATPQRYPYPEKVLGFAANPPSIFEDPATEVPFFRPAWWSGDEGNEEQAGSAKYNRHNAIPEQSQFCGAANDCQWGRLFTPDYGGDGTPGWNVIGEPAGPCAHRTVSGKYDLKCWWHSPAAWKGNCPQQCGNEFIRYDWPAYAAEPENGKSYPPACGKAGLPAGLRIIDDVPNSVPSVRVPSCAGDNNHGTFDLSFNGGSDGETSKIDFHQIGGGFGAHYWFSHTRSADPQLHITGKWSWNQPINGWARVFVHIPDHKTHTRQARYRIDLGNGKFRERVIPTRIRENKWVSLGAFPFAGKPGVTLRNVTIDGKGLDAVAWDAAAVLPLSGKPKEIIAALGDSYSSGEGASQLNGADYDRETDLFGNNKDLRNACHRSRFAWSRQMALKDSAVSVYGRTEAMDSDIDYRLVACSGARTHNILPYGQQNALGRTSEGQYGEVPQLESGFVDEDTTLVTLSIGGNDSRFADVIKFCVMASTKCQNNTMDGDSEKLEVALPKHITGPVSISLRQTITQIWLKAPNAQIVLVGYPTLIEGSCVFGIDSAEVPWLKDIAQLLAQQMQAAVDERASVTIPVHFANPELEFRGKGVCAEPELIHGIVTQLTPGDDPVFKYSDTHGIVSAQGFHPKISGASAYARVVERTLRSINK